MEQNGQHTEITTEHLFHRDDSKQLNKEYLLQQIGAQTVLLNMSKIVGSLI